MKKTAKVKSDMLPEYDISEGMTGKYAHQIAKGTNVVILDPDGAKIFRDGKSVNRSLRRLVKLRELTKRKNGRP
jgi:hypothetical protein